MRQLKRIAQIISAQIDGVLFGQPDEYRVQRLFWASVTGFGLACAYWEFVLSSLGIPERFENAIYLGLLLLLGIGYPTSVHIRCTCVLICVGFFGKAGRGYLKAILFGLIIAGPVYNLTLNCKEVVRVFQCSAKLTYNLTRTRYDLLTFPFRRSLHQLPHNVSLINRSFEKITFVVHPLREEILEKESTKTRRSSKSFHSLPSRNKRMSDNERTADKIQSNYQHKIRNRCQVQMDRGLGRCRQAFRKAYDECMVKLPVVVGTMLCWPMKLAVVCKVVMPGGEDVCDPKGKLDPSMGADFIELEQTVDLLSPVQVNVSTEGGRSTMSGIEKNSKETSSQILRDIDRKWHSVSAYLFLLRKFLAWTFLKVVKSIFFSDTLGNNNKLLSSSDAILYRRKYLNEINFDNVYISNYFRRVDARRGTNARRKLLPMKKIEKSKLIRVISCKRSRREFWSMLAQLCKTSLEMLVAACFLLLDHLMTVAMQTIRDHSRIEFVQEGEHVIDIQVNGTGVMAQMVRNSIASANIDVDLKLVTDNSQCLPQPSHLSTADYLRITALFIVMLGLIYIETYLQRVRHCIAAYFFFRREKQRVLYAYNAALKRRRGLLRQTLHQVQEDLRHDGRGSIWFGGLCHRLPMCWWLRWLPVCRRHCIVCKDPEPFRMDRSLVDECMLCRTVYCNECWHEMGAVCVVCRHLGRQTGGGDGVGYDRDYVSESEFPSDSSDSDA